MIERDAGGREEAGGADVLDLYLEMARARLSPPRFEAVVRAVQETCGLLAQGHQALVVMPGDEGFSPDLQREYLALLAVMITGSLDHQVVELPGPDGVPALAVVRTTNAPGQQVAGQGVLDAARHSYEPPHGNSVMTTGADKAR
ncbi:hypothetical protein ACFY7H_29370 [Streptomyces sp. NPDC012794]|uniref:hypothetical protein n=1 Tax=Streptomyces sp. NPDC012794 TaxID=3364850 RepID=UPI0036C0A5F7